MNPNEYYRLKSAEIKEADMKKMARRLMKNIRFRRSVRDE